MAESPYEALSRDDIAGLKAALSGNPALLSASDEDGRTPLIFAAYEGNLDAFRLLATMGSDPDATDLGGRNAFLVAAGEGHTAIVDHLLSQSDGHGGPAQLLASRSKSGNTALHRAAAYGHVGVVRRLLEAGAAMNEVNDDGATPLCRAARWGHADVAVVLLDAGADATIADGAGNAPAQWAATKGWEDVAAVLRGERPALAAADGHHEAPAAAAAHAGGRERNGSNSSSAGDGGGGHKHRHSSHGHGHHHHGHHGSSSKHHHGDGHGHGHGHHHGHGHRKSSSAGGGGGSAEAGSVLPPAPMRVEGWMAKQGHFVKNWKNRWFVLEGRSIFYYSREGASRARGSIEMVPGTDVLVEERYAKPFCFTIATPVKRFELQAADEGEMEAWLEAVTNNLECCEYTPPQAGGGGAQHGSAGGGGVRKAAAGGKRASSGGGGGSAKKRAPADDEDDGGDGDDED